MGQDHSKVLDSHHSKPNPKHKVSSSPSSLKSLLAEATTYGNEDVHASLEAKAQKALECPCVQNLKSGTCGSHFSEAFLCFMRSTSEEKGSDCVHPFVALQTCIQTNPNAFPKDVLETNEADAVDKPVGNYKIKPPKWSVKLASPKTNL